MASGPVRRPVRSLTVDEALRATSYRLGVFSYDHCPLRWAIEVRQNRTPGIKTDILDRVLGKMCVLAHFRRGARRRLGSGGHVEGGSCRHASHWHPIPALSPSTRPSRHVMLGRRKVNQFTGIVPFILYFPVSFIFSSQRQGAPIYKSALRHCSLEFPLFFTSLWHKWFHCQAQDERLTLSRNVDIT